MSLCWRSSPHRHYPGFGLGAAELSTKPHFSPPIFSALDSPDTRWPDHVLAGCGGSSTIKGSRARRPSCRRAPPTLSCWQQQFLPTAARTLTRLLRHLESFRTVGRVNLCICTVAHLRTVPSSSTSPAADVVPDEADDGNDGERASQLEGKSLLILATSNLAVDLTSGTALYHAAIKPNTSQGATKMAVQSKEVETNAKGTFLATLSISMAYSQPTRRSPTDQGR